MRVEAVTGAGDAFLASAWSEDPRTAAAVARGKDGDRDAVRFLYERYADGVRQLAYRMLGDPDSADDLTQTVFLSLLTKLDR
jgi:RNA polymerase sigma-70 factor (ECF subfamily)